MNASDLITLVQGPTVPLAALQLAWDLEARGISLDDDGEHLLVRPRDRITDSDREQIRRWRDPLRAIVAACRTASMRVPQ